MLEPALIEPKLLVWAALRRAGSTRLWWEAPHRARSLAMVEDGLARGDRLAIHETSQAIELSQLLRRAAEISDAGHPVVREMHALHQNVQAYLAAARGGAACGGAAGGGAGVGGAGLGLGSGERPSGQAVPAHIRKMGKRYDDHLEPHYLLLITYYL